MIRNTFLPASFLLGAIFAWGQPTPLERGQAVNNLTNPAQPPWTPDVVSRLRVPAGFRVQVFARDLGNSRMIAVSESGAVYVTRRRERDVVMLRDMNGDGVSDEMRVIARDLPWINGIHIYRGTLYLATDKYIYSAALGADGIPLALNRIVSDLPDAGQHPNRTLAVGPDNMLYVTIGSTCNVCREPNPLSATIQRYELNGGGRVSWAEGLRNTIGFGWHPTTGEMWAMDHGSDGRGDNVPPEELNRIERGTNYGWPWCYGDRQVDRLFSMSPPSGTREQYCATTRPPVLPYQAHSAPLAFAFPIGAAWPAEYRTDAFVTMRGSWNRENPTGYKVVRVRFNSGQPASFEDFITGWLSEDGLTSYGRPTGLVFHTDGSMLVSDDHNGVIYRVSPGTQPAAMANIRAVASGVGGTATTSVSPGGLITITGSNLARGDSNSGDVAGQTIPTSLGGVQVTIADRTAPIVTITPTMIVAQVPYDVPAGQQRVVVTNNSVSSSAFTVTVASNAPTLFSDLQGGVIQRAGDYSRISPTNPARAGDVLILYATGLGQTSPAQMTGVLTPGGALANTAPVTVTLGAANAEVLSSVASPGFAGLFQVNIRVPAGVSGASLPLMIQVGSMMSSPVLVPIAGEDGGVMRPGRAAQLDPQVQAVVEQYMALGPKPIETLTPQEARQQPSVADAVRALLQRQGRSTAPEPVGSVADRTIPGPAGPLPVRVYTPQGTGPFPVVVYFHGGGWVIATIDTYDASARALTNAAGAIVVSVEYRKAPENKFPAAAEDAYAAVQWVMNNAASINGRPDRVAVAGESAGGNLATVASMMARDRMGRMPVHQLLVYPVTNYGFDTPSYMENANAPFLTRAAMIWFWGHYLTSPQDGQNPYASALRGTLAGLPPATVITAGFDPLRDDGAAYADKLRQSGVRVDYRNYPDMTHEFFGMGAVVDDARQAVQQAGANLKTALQ